MRIELSKRFAKRVEGLFGKYNFEVGVLNDGPHYEPRERERGQGFELILSTYAGGPTRKRTRTTTKTIGEVSKANRERLGFNYLSEPFKNRSSEIIKFSQAFFDLVFGRSQQKRCENLLQAIVRNPILRGEYGPQKRVTINEKGFDRPMIDTGQLFKAIRAQAKVVKRV